MIKCWLTVCILSLFLLASCNDDDEFMPSYRQDLAELQTDNSGKAVFLILDDGRCLNIENELTGLVPDTLFRVRALYVEHEQSVFLNSAMALVSSKPVPSELISSMTDPVAVKAIWKSPRYVNMLLDIQTGGGQQSFGFVDRGIITSQQGIRKLKIQLYHEQLEDPLYYTHETYMSCPIYDYASQLEAGRDSVEFEINTFNGIFRKSFLY